MFRGPLGGGGKILMKGNESLEMVMEKKRTQGKREI